MKQNKIKSILGLNTVKAFIVVLLSLAIIAIVTLIVLASINSANTIPLASGSAANQKTTAVVNETGVNLGVLSLGYTNVICSGLTAVNSTSNTAIPAGNITTSNNGCKIAFTSITASADNFNNSYWNVTYSYTYYSDAQNGVNGIIGNTSTGMISFFTNSGTYFSLLGVVVIILIISLVVVVVNRFGGEAGQGGQVSTM